MITISGNNGDKIELSFNDTIQEYERNMYMIEMPTVICNNRRNAKFIQEKVEAFVSELSKAILKDK